MAVTGHFILTNGVSAQSSFFSDARNKKSIEPLSLVLPYDCNILVHYKN